MPALVILAPARPRPGARGAAAAAGAGSEFDYVLGAGSGRALPAALPRGDTTSVVVADADIAWHRVTLPRAPASRLRAALGGVLEDQLLADDDVLHLALAPKSTPGQPAWVAVIDKAWLVALLSALEAAGVTVDRVVPSSQPGADDSGHFTSDPAEPDAAPTLTLAHADGVTVLRAAGTLARSLLPAELSAVRWTASPPAAAAAERWLGAPVAVATDAERALAAVATAAPAWDLRQFDLAPRHRGTRAARDAWRRFWSADWRPVRWGVAALVVVQLLGLNLLAWRQQRALSDRRAEMTALLQSAHPGVRSIIDAPLQMQRETDLLRATAGRSGETDLDVLLGAAAAAWPDGQGPAQTLRYDAGRLTLGAAGWGEPQLAQFRQRLKPAGYGAELADGRVSVSRGTGRAL